MWCWPTAEDGAELDVAAASPDVAAFLGTAVDVVGENRSADRNGTGRDMMSSTSCGGTGAVVDAMTAAS